MTDRLDHLLTDAAVSVSFPPTPPLADAVVAGLAGRRPPRRGWSATAWSRPLVLAALLTLVLAGTVAALAFVLPGLRIVPVASLPPVPATDLGAVNGLGRAVDPSEVPGLVWPASLGEPDAVRVSTLGVVSLIYAPDETLPEIGDSGIGLVFQLVDGSLDAEMIEKLVVEVGATVEPIEVDGAAGFWIDGPPPLYRLEAEIDRDAAIDIAETLGP